MAKNPMQRALQQADAITAGNRQLESLTATGSAGPGPLFNDRRMSPNEQVRAANNTRNAGGSQAAQSRAVRRRVTEPVRGASFSPPQEKRAEYVEGYDHGLLGAQYKGYGGRPAAIAYGAGYQHGKADQPKKKS